MTASELLKEIEGRGGVVTVTPDSDAPQLRIAPRGLVPDLMSDIRRLKPDLLELLTAPLAGSVAHRWRDEQPPAPDSVEARRARLRALNGVYGIDSAARKVVRRWRQMQKRAYDTGERARRDWESVHPATRHDLVVCALLLDAGIDPHALAD